MSLARILRDPWKPTQVARLSADPIRAAAKRIYDRWPEVVPAVVEKDQEKLVRDIDEKMHRGDWGGVSVAKVAQAARVLFSAPFRERKEFSELLNFYLEEIKTNRSSGFINSMFSVYLTNYEPRAEHTVAQAEAFIHARDRIGARWQHLLKQVPELLDPLHGHERLGARMIEMPAIWDGLRLMGFNAPHAPGILDHAHLYYLEKTGDAFAHLQVLEKLFLWIQPRDARVRLSGAAQTIDAMIRPWLGQRFCPDEVRKPLVERILAIYGDPRVSRLSHWNLVRRECLDLLHRWLTKADMSFFIEVVNQTQGSHMWPPRRDFWFRRYEDGQIDAAWVAFCPDAARLAGRLLLAQHNVNVGERFGRQVAGGSRGDTSLLIMKIGHKIVVDGCHSYKTHIFHESDRAAPALFRRTYDCEAIRLSSTRSKSHSPIGSWKEWVMQNI